MVVVNSTEPLTAFDYAMKIAESWKPGAKGKDNGVVFLVAVKDHQMFILTGYGVEGVLPDGKVGAIRDQLVRPAFRRGDYAGGIRAGTEAMAAIIAEGAGVRLQGGAAGSGRSHAATLRVRFASHSVPHHIPAAVLPLSVLAAVHGWPGGLVGCAGGGFGGGASAVVAAASAGLAAAASAAAVREATGEEVETERSE